MSVYVFSGPTLGRVEVEAHTGATWKPPVRHGDLLALRAGPSDTVLIIDGLFHQVAPVRHKEILHIIDEGVTVVGAASMGALRAVELGRYGMIGAGVIVDWYRTGRIESDEEVVVVHLDQDDYRPMSEPLVNIRHALDDLTGRGDLSGDDAAILLRLAREMPYTSRSWIGLEKHAAEHNPALGERVGYIRAERARDPHRWNLKRHDAIDALRRVMAGQLTSKAAPLPGRWRTCYLDAWRSRYETVPAPNGGAVPLVALLQFQQLFDRDFPNRWRRHMLRWIAGVQNDAAYGDVADGDLADLALSAARRRGFDSTTLSNGQIGRSLTPSELGLTSAERELRMLTRSGVDPTALPPEQLRPATGGLVTGAEGAAKAIAAAFALNRSVASRGRARTLRDIRRERIESALARLWHVDLDDPDAERQARARDRGFASWADAVEAMRPFYLWARAAGAV